MSELRIYVACLASYNAGRLHGGWIPISTDVDEMQAEIDSILRESPCPNVIRARYHCEDCDEDRTITVSYGEAAPVSVECEHCGKPASAVEQYHSAEEWAIHDYDGSFPNFGENPSLQKIADYAELIEAAEVRGLSAELASVVLDHYGAEYISEAREAIEDRYQGRYDSLEDYAAELLEDIGEFENVPEYLRNYIDFKAYGRDLELGGDVFTIRDSEGLHVFWSN